MQRIFLVRHGETDWNLQMRFQGREDIPLNEKGKRQALSLANYLKGEKLAAIYTSGLTRALETASIIAKPHNLSPLVVKGLEEIDFGEWEGKTYQEMDKQERIKLSSWLLSPETGEIPGGESFNEFINRVMGCYEKLLNFHCRENFLIVTHAGAIKILVAGILGMPFMNIIRLMLAPASLSVINYDDRGNPFLELFNWVCQ